MINKSDLPRHEGHSAIWPTVSARTGDGLPRLMEQLADWLVPHDLPSGAAVPFSPEQESAVLRAVDAMLHDQPDVAREAIAELG